MVRNPNKVTQLVPSHAKLKTIYHVSLNHWPTPQIPKQITGNSTKLSSPYRSVCIFNLQEQTPSRPRKKPPHTQTNNLTGKLSIPNSLSLSLRISLNSVNSFHFNSANYLANLEKCESHFRFINEIEWISRFDLWAMIRGISISCTDALFEAIFYWCLGIGVREVLV